MSTLKMDREVYAVVRKLEDELDEASAATSKPPRLLTVSFVYESIRRSNSSLARNKKKVLETSIEKVLDSRRAEAHADARVDMDDLIEAAEESKKTESSSRDASLLNRQIAKGWGFSTKMPKPQSPGSSAPPERAVSTPAEDAAGRPEDANGTKGASERQSNGEPRPKKRRWAKSDADRAPSTNVSIRDVAGVDDALNRLLHEVWFPLCAGEACEKMGYRFDNGVLLHGPSGCGKTTLAHAVAGSVGASFIPVSATSLISGTSGESEKNIRDVFSEAILIAPCLIFFDELDAIAGNRDSANKGMESRIVSELMAGMDRIKQQTTMGRNVVVLAATNRPEALDPSIRRRFGAEIDMGMPSEPAREQILRSLTRDLSLAPDVYFPALAKLTPGFVGSDLQHVVKAAVSESFRGSLDALLAHAAALAPPPPSAETTATTTPAQQSWLLLESHRRAPWSASHITHAQFLTAIARTQPASKREGFSTIPDTTWAHVGALGPVRRRLEMSIIGPIKNPDLFTKVGIAPAAGILLWGPPGCGKTLVAKAVANESKANFISIKGPELLNKYVGESERAVRQLFARAKGSAPCILFFDEMDALVPKRDDSLSDASARVVNTLLTELDGVGDRSGIYVIGATNRPDIIDEAIRRPGRLGTSIYVGLPSADDRVDILRTLYRNSIGKKGGESTVDLEVVARDRRCDGFSGADLGNLMQAAAQACLERAYLGLVAGQEEIMMEGVTIDPVITMEDWEAALKTTKPSVKDAEMYNEIQ